MAIVHNLTDGMGLGEVASRKGDAILRRGNRFGSLVSVVAMLIALCVNSGRGNIVPTEIMYHPAGTTTRG